MRTRYALDFRLMTERRIAILDASYSIFAADIPTPKPPSNGPSNSGNGNNKNSSSGSGSNSNLSSLDASVLLQQIPDFKKVVAEIVRGEAGNGVFSIDVGLICGVEAVKRVGKALHNRLVLRPAKPPVAGPSTAAN